jgi:hypothetical protein
MSKDLFETTDIMWERMKKLRDFPLKFPHKYPTPALDRCLTRLGLWVDEAYQMAREMEGVGKTASKLDCTCPVCKRRRCGCEACALLTSNHTDNDSKKVSLKFEL